MASEGVLAAEAVVAVAAPTAADDAAPAAVVGLDADEAEQGAALTRALRRAFAARGLSGGKEVNLSELRLALGCKKHTPECLVRGGAMLDARRLIYGTLRRAEGKGWILEATLLEVDGGATTTASVPLADADLEAARLDATAAAIADRLAPDTAVSAMPTQGSGELTPPPPAPEPEAEAAEPSAAEDEGKHEHKAAGKLHWGWQRPQPRWKLVGFGVSAGVMAVTAGFTIGTGVWLTSKSWGFRKKLVDAANASLSDENPINDVDPNLPNGVNLCEYAKSRPEDENGNLLGMPGQVRNRHVAEVCNQGDDIRKAQVMTGIMTGVGALATVTFALLLFVHREPARESAWRRHRLHVSVDPVRGQGMSLRMGGRF
jgi:hypothetical protein